MSTDPTGLGESTRVAETSPPRSGVEVDERSTDGTVVEDARGPRTDRAPEPSPDAADRRGQRNNAAAPPRRSRRNRKVRKVHRVVRHLEIWSVAKVAAIFAACTYVVALVSGYLLWRAADRVGTIDGIEGFFEDAGGYDRFQILGDVVFRSAAVIGLVLALLTVFLVVLAAVLFNLISDLTGGIRMTVIDEDLIVAPTPRRRSGQTVEGERSRPA